MAFSLDKHSAGGAGGGKQLGPFSRELASAGKSAAGFARSAREADLAVTAWARNAIAAASVKSPSASTAPTSGGATGAAGDGGVNDIARIGEMARQIGPVFRNAINEGLAPLNQFATRFSSQFNIVGGTIVTLAKRIDAQMKFPALQTAIVKTREKLVEWGTAGSGSMDKIRAAANRTLGVMLGFEKLKSMFGSFGSVVRPLGKLGAISLAKPLGEARGLGQAFKAAQPAVAGLTGSVRSLGLQIAAALGFVGIAYKLIDFFHSGITGAINLNETVSKTKEVFGDSTAAITAQADSMSRAFGLSKGEQLDVASGFGLITQGVGMAEGKSADLANTFTKLAADASSFYNIPFAEAAAKLRSGLTGEMEPLKAFGVVINETTMKAEALRLGLARGKGELTESAKVAARASLIQRGLAAAQGDLERTSGGAANQFRKAGGGITNFATRIGELLLPAVTTGITAFNEFLAVTLEVFEANLPTVQGWFSYVGGAVDQVAKLVRNFGTYWQILTLRVGEFGANTVAYLEMLPENFGTVMSWIGRNWQTMLGDMIVAAGTFGTNLATNFANLGKAIWEALKGGEFNFSWTPLMEGFRAETEKFPELAHGALISVQKEVDSLYSQMEAKEAKRAQTLAGQAAKAKAKPGPAEAAKKESENKVASAAELGSSEAISAIAKFSNQSRDQPLKSLDKTAKDQLAEQKKQTLTLAQLVKNGAKLSSYTF